MIDHIELITFLLKLKPSCANCKNLYKKTPYDLATKEISKNIFLNFNNSSENYFNSTLINNKDISRKLKNNVIKTKSTNLMNLKKNTEKKMKYQVRNNQLIFTNFSENKNSCKNINLKSNIKSQNTKFLNNNKTYLKTNFTNYFLDSPTKQKTNLNHFKYSEYKINNTNKKNSDAINMENFNKSPIIKPIKSSILESKIKGNNLLLNNVKNSKTNINNGLSRENENICFGKDNEYICSDEDEPNIIEELDEGVNENLKNIKVSLNNQIKNGTSVFSLSNKQITINHTKNNSIIQPNNLLEINRINKLKENISSVSLKKEIGINDFQCISLLGHGSYAEVYLVRKIDSKTLYAMKVLDKSKIERENISKYALTERNILSRIDSPFIVKLHYAFQTNEKLFLILTYCSEGDLSKQIKINKKFSEEKAKFYLCQVTLAL